MSMDPPPERSCCVFGRDDLYCDNMMSRFILDISKVFPLPSSVGNDNNATKDSEGTPSISHNYSDHSKKDEDKDRFVLINDNARVINKYRPKQYQYFRLGSPLSLHSSLFVIESNNSVEQNIDRWGTNCSNNMCDRSPTIVKRRLSNLSSTIYSHNNNKSDIGNDIPAGMISDPCLTIP